MARDTFRQIWGEVLSVCPAAGAGLAQQWVRDGWRTLAEKDLWSWQVKRGQVTVPAPYSTGTATFTFNSDVVTFAGAALTQNMVGRQIRRSTSDPIYTITRVDDIAGEVTIYPAWGDDTAVGSAYSIAQLYITPPDDFFAFQTIVDMSRPRRLHLNVSQSELDFWDPWRDRGSEPACLSFVGYGELRNGSVGSVIRADGAGPRPSSSGVYTGTSDAVFIVEVTLGGAVGVATYRWKKNDEAWVAGALTDNAAFELKEGVYVAWPNDIYVLGNIFVIRTRALSSVNLPMYEVYPHPTTQRILKFEYIVRSQDISDTGFVLPPYIRGDVIKSYALSEAARWPGTDNKRNPFEQIARAEFYMAQFLAGAAEAMRQDQEVAVRSVSTLKNIPYADLPWRNDARSQDYDPDDIYPV